LANAGRVHAVTLWGGALVVASFPLRLAVSGTTFWREFATWATG